MRARKRRKRKVKQAHMLFLNLIKATEDLVKYFGSENILRFPKQQH